MTVDELNPEGLAQLLKRKRLAAGLSLSDASVKTGVVRDTIHNREAGRGLVEAAEILRYLESLGCVVTVRGPYVTEGLEKNRT